MKRCAFLSVLAICLAMPSVVAAQGSSDWNHAEVGVFADYFRLSRTTPDINFVGLGGRAAFNVHPNVQLEAEMAYDFKRNFTSTFSNGINTQLVNTRLRPLTALFGPKFQAGTSGPFRAFVTGKLGFVNFSTSNQNASAGFTSALGGVTDGNTQFAVCASHLVRKSAFNSSCERESLIRAPGIFYWPASSLRRFLARRNTC